MTDTTNDAASAAAAQAPALKSSDTRTVVIAPEPAAAVEVVPEVVETEGHVVTHEGVDDAPEADSPEGKKDRLPRWVKERLERVRRVTEAETRERTLREVQQQQAPRQEPAKPEPATDKRLEDFDFDHDAYTAYLVERAVDKREQQRIAEQQAQEQAKAAESFNARIDAFEEKVGAGAWEDIQASAINTNPKFKPLVELFLGDENDLQIAHHFATNPKDADRLLALSPLQRVKELAKLADAFSGSPDPKPAPNLPKKTTNAPPPPKTVSGAGVPSVDLDSPEITTAQRIAEWKRKGKK